MIKGIVFDFDGVLVESVDIKGDAFVALYDDEGLEFQEKVLAYHRANGGVTRFEKIQHYEEELLGRSLTPAQVEAKAARFGEIVEDKVVEAAWVPGAKNFLNAYHQKFPLFVASATPEEELRRIMKRRNAMGYFKDVFGTPIKKQEHLMRIMQRNGWGPDDIVMIGDAMTDYNAAKANKVPFVGRVGYDVDNPFPEGTTIIPDLHSLAAELGIA